MTSVLSNEDNDASKKLGEKYKYLMKISLFLINVYKLCFSSFFNLILEEDKKK